MRGLRISLLPALALLAACGEQTPERTDDAREAEGEVLGGTISDEMLPLDQLRSQSPILRDAPSAPVEDSEAEAGDSADGDDGAAPAQPAPASEEAPAGE